MLDMIVVDYDGCQSNSVGDIFWPMLRDFTRLRYGKNNRMQNNENQNTNGVKKNHKMDRGGKR